MWVYFLVPPRKLSPPRGKLSGGMSSCQGVLSSRVVTPPPEVVNWSWLAEGVVRFSLIFSFEEVLRG